MTTVTTRNPVRSDLAAEASAPTRPTRRAARGWVVAGVAAGVLGIGTMVTSSMINAIYDKSILGDEDAILAKLADQSVRIMTFQVVASLGALALVGLVVNDSSIAVPTTMLIVIAPVVILRRTAPGDAQHPGLRGTS